MAKVRLNTGGKILLVLLGLVLVGVAVWQLLPKPTEEDKQGIKPDFSASADGTDPKDNTSKTDTKDTAKPTPDKTKPAVDASGSTPGLGRPLKVAIVTWGGYAGGIVANNGFKANKESTFWKEYGIEVELQVIDDYPASRAAFKTGGDKGGVDIMWGTVDAFALEYDSLKETNPLAFMQYDWSRGGDAIAVSEGINKVADLKGKRIAVAEATPSHYFALYLISQAELKTGDVNWVFTSSAIEAAQLFRQGRTDAAVSWSPDVYQAANDRKGAKILASTREASALIADIFVARGDFAEKHPELLAKFMLGWFDGVEQVIKDPSSSYTLMSKGFEGVDMEAAKGMLGDVKLPTYAENLAFFEVTGDQLRGYSDIYQEASKLWRSLGKTSGRTQPQKTFDAKYLQAIRAEAEKRFGKVEEAKVTKAATNEFKFNFDAAAKKAAVKQDAILTKRISIFFPSGKSTLDDNSKFILDEAARLAQTFGSVRMRVTGNTDSVGNRTSNVKLSEQRAGAVVKYLVQKHGFPQDKFVVVGAGPDNPIDNNKTSEGRQRNRRTDFEIIK